MSFDVAVCGDIISFNWLEEDLFTCLVCGLMMRSC